MLRRLTWRIRDEETTTTTILGPLFLHGDLFSHPRAQPPQVAAAPLPVADFRVAAAPLPVAWTTTSTWTTT